MFTITNGFEYISFEVNDHFPISDSQSWESYFLRVKGVSDFISYDKIIDADGLRLKEFYSKLKDCYEALQGTCEMKKFSYDADFSIKLVFDRLGGVQVTASIISLHRNYNNCNIEFYTDQTFIADTLTEMKKTFGFND